MTLAHGQTSEQDRVQRAADVRGALELLAPEIRQVLVLTYFGGRSTAEVAVTLGVPLQTVRRSLFQGLRILGSSFDDQGSSFDDQVTGPPQVGAAFTPQEQRRRA